MISSDELIEKIKETYEKNNVEYDLTEGCEEIITQYHKSLLEDQQGVKSLPLGLVHWSNVKDTETLSNSIIELFSEYVTVFREAFLDTARILNNSVIELQKNGITDENIDNLVDMISSITTAPPDEVYSYLNNENVEIENKINTINDLKLGLNRKIAKFQERLQKIKDIDIQLKEDGSFSESLEEGFVDVTDPEGLGAFLPFFMDLIKTLPPEIEGVPTINVDNHVILIQSYIASILKFRKFESKFVIETRPGKVLVFDDESEEGEDGPSLKDIISNKMNQLAMEEGMEAANEYLHNKMTGDLAEEVEMIIITSKKGILHIMFRSFKVEEDGEEKVIAPLYKIELTDTEDSSKMSGTFSTRATDNPLSKSSPIFRDFLS